MYRSTLFASTFAAVAYAQQAGVLTTETHPSLPIQSCAAGGACTTLETKIVLDANWRWTHDTSGFTNCYTGNTWNATLCPDATTCAANCALDGADYAGVYGITTSGNSLKMGFVTGSNVGSRVYLMDTTDTTYKLFKLKGQEFTMDIDVSQLPCGLNGAVYFSEMEADGGSSKYPTNKAGAKYGTGYCDSQCPSDLKFINGESNSVGWTPDSNSANSGSGNYGSCCNELDIWEANTISTAFTPHPCSVSGGSYRCTGTECGDGADRYNGVCDADGCDFNSYRMGNKTFYGPGSGFNIDTTKPITAVTQFVTSDGTAAGTLTEIKRFYVQNGVIFANSAANIAGVPADNAITDDFCAAQKSVFGDTSSFATKGGLATMGASMDRGQVLVLSIWDDYEVNMLWLDSTYPTTSTAPGSQRGSCPITSGVPAQVEADYPDAYVIYSNIKIGPIGSTFSAGTGTGTPVSSSTADPVTTPTATSPAGTVPRYGQCGGINYTGSTVCAAGSTCTYSSPYYSQCL
ncbi:cellulase [Calycina marina]|uniref:Glucanase n=1 Tax=Calycina marina TaxID=1763456 RepID=A0A9P7Z7B7_9HELO|nr:cellulase [Calycina marina]